MAAYRQGKQAADTDFKLSSNENPFDPLPSVVEAVALQVAFNRYPDSSAQALRERLGEFYGIEPERFQIGAGSVALLSQAITAVAGPGDEVVYPWRSFEAYPGLVTVAGATSVPVPNLPDTSHDLEGMLAAITDKTRAVILCSPNNPTGTVLSKAQVENFLSRVPNDVLVIVDEAYVELAREAGASDALRDGVLDRHPNVLVMRTFSKAYGIAALRVGYAVGSEEVINLLRSVAIPLSVTATGIAGAIASLDASAELTERVEAIIERRERVWRGFEKAGWEVPEPHGNFIWLPTGDKTDAVAEAFGDAGFVVRAFPGDGIRISIGEEESVEKLVETGTKILSDVYRQTR